MNKIANKFLLARDKIMPGMHLKRFEFNYRACVPFIKNKERIQKCMQTEDTWCICRNELDKACFQHVMACGSNKYVVKRTESDKILRDKALKTASDPGKSFSGFKQRC